MERQSYATDLTDEQWAAIEPHLPKPKTKGRTGRPRSIPLREIVNALLYQVKSGCKWELLPHDLPNYKTVYTYFRYWTIDGTIQRIHDALREQVRTQEGRDPTPSAALVDSQSVKTTEKGGSVARSVSTAANSSKAANAT